ncbi:MAG: hypothetical protein M1297_08515 [Nitrospirae bacterium]|jgi:hypothetical protein|nr:hypothetical protein [Nitrospirota bacterium]
MKTFLSILTVLVFLFAARVDAAPVLPVPSALPLSPEDSTLESGHFLLVFDHAFSFQRIRTALDLSDKWIFLTLFHDREIVHVDLETGKQVGVDMHVRNPVFAAFDPGTRNLIVAQGNSRDYYVTPVGRDGPPEAVRTGLNPSWVGGDPDLGYYVLAGAVHLLYRLDRREEKTLDWTALGDRVRTVTVDPAGKRIAFPLYRKERLITLSLPLMQKEGEVDLGNCDHPRQILTGRKQGEQAFLVLCRDGIYEGSGDPDGFRRLSRFRRKSGMMVRIGNTELLAISFPESRMIRLWSVRTHRFVRTLRLEGRPVFLQGIPGSFDFLLVLDNPLDRESRVRRVRWVPDGGATVPKISQKGVASGPTNPPAVPSMKTGTGEKSLVPPKTLH